MKLRCLGPLLALSLTACLPIPIPIGGGSDDDAKVVSNGNTPVVDTQGAQVAISRVLDDWHDAAAKADENRYFGHLGEDSIFMGTDPKERWNKRGFWEYAHPHFAKGKAWSFKSVRRAINVDGPSGLAWFDEDLDTPGLGPARGSGVLANRNGTWQIVLYVLSVTVSNDRFDIYKDAAHDAEVVHPEKGPLTDLAFLSGAWIGTGKSGETIEEHWSEPAAGEMMGMGREIRAGSVASSESLRIEARRDGSIVYVASPKGAPRPTEFKRVKESAPGEIVFENPLHDFPRKITYKKDGAKLRVKLEGQQPTEELILQRAVISRD